MKKLFPVGRSVVLAVVAALSCVVPAALAPQSASGGYTLPVSYEAAYAYRTDIPDPAMKAIPRTIDALRARDPDEYLRRLAEYITENAADSFDLVKKAHDAVSLTVRYDAAGFWSRRIGDQDYRTVLRTRVAVCEGYSNLFKRLCDELGVRCDIVYGYGRGVGTSPESVESPYDSNHAWNIVIINNESYLIDCTWNAGHMDGRVAKQDYTTDYLFIKPEHLLYTHFPLDSSQQLLARPLSADEFTALPFIRPKFFDAAGNLSVEITKIMRAENSLSIEYTCNEDYSLSFNVSDARSGRKVENRTFILNNGATRTVLFSFPTAGRWNVDAYWWKADSRRGEGCAEFIVETSAANDVQYPLTYSTYGVIGEILSPVEMPLVRGETYTFHVKTDKKVAAVIYGRNYIQLAKGEDGSFTLELTIPQGIRELYIGTADYVNGRYEYLAQYRVRQ